MQAWLPGRGMICGMACFATLVHRKARIGVSVFGLKGQRCYLTSYSCRLTCNNFSLLGERRNIETAPLPQHMFLLSGKSNVIMYYIACSKQSPLQGLSSEKGEGVLHNVVYAYLLALTHTCQGSGVTGPHKMMDRR